MRTQALFSILSAKLASGKMIFVDSIPAQDGKTKDANETMKGLTKIEGFKTLCYKKPNNVYMTVSKSDEKTKRAFRNLPYMTMHNMDDLNPLDIANSRYLVIANPEDTIAYLSTKVGSKASVSK